MELGQSKFKVQNLAPGNLTRLLQRAFARKLLLSRAYQTLLTLPNRIIFAAPRTELKGTYFAHSGPTFSKSPSSFPVLAGYQCCNLQRRTHISSLSPLYPSLELHVLRDILMHKYGREFSLKVMDNKEGVSERVSLRFYDLTCLAFADSGPR